MVLLSIAVVPYVKTKFLHRQRVLAQRANRGAQGSTVPLVILEQVGTEAPISTECLRNPVIESSTL